MKKQGSPVIRYVTARCDYCKSPVGVGQRRCHACGATVPGVVVLNPDERLIDPSVLSAIQEKVERQIALSPREENFRFK